MRDAFLRDAQREDLHRWAARRVRLVSPQALSKTLIPGRCMEDTRWDVLTCRPRRVDPSDLEGRRNAGFDAAGVRLRGDGRSGFGK